MILRVLNLAVIAALILAAAYVYRIKFDATVQAERLAKIRSEIRRERDTIAALRAEWGELENPARIETLAKRFLRLKPITAAQFDQLDQLPERPPSLVPPDSPDPIGTFIENFEEPVEVTGSISGPAPAAADADSPEPPAAVPPAAAAPPPGGSGVPDGGVTKSGRLDR